MIDMNFDRASGKKRITKIAITGGPCGGKSTAMSWIQNNYTKQGYKVLFVPETATELITAGVRTNCGTSLLQEAMIDLQLEKERVFELVADKAKGDKLLIVCDRGVVDCRAYMPEQEYLDVLARSGHNEVEVRDNYDAVFHLVTAAKGAKEFYTCANNTARSETPEQAAEQDDKLIAAWTGHPHFYVIGNEGDFRDKMLRLMHAIDRALGDTDTFVADRKQLIEYPDIAWLESLPNCHRVEIEQTYLVASGGAELRVRKRGENGSYTYYETEKLRLSGGKRTETEHRLTRGDYERQLLFADPNKRTIKKTRYCLSYNDRYYEIDVFPFWNDRAIVETELGAEDEPIDLPEKLRLICDVTDDPRYFNSSLAEPGGCDIPLV